MRPCAVRGREWLLAVGVLALVALLVVFPMLVCGPSLGTAFSFLFTSWVAASLSMKAGIWHPHWMPQANWGAGEPRFTFYPPFPWMLGGLLGLLLPWKFVPLAMGFLFLLANGLSVRKLAREWLSARAALLAGVLVMVLGYLPFCLYHRAAFGELAGSVFLPLMLLYVLRKGGDAKGLRARVLDATLLKLALAVMLIWLASVPVGVMAVYTALFLAALAAWRGRSWEPFLRPLLGMAAGMGMAAFYLLPAWFERHFAALEGATHDPYLRFDNAWLFDLRFFHPAAEAALHMHDNWHWRELMRISLMASVLLLLSGWAVMRLKRQGAVVAPEPGKESSWKLLTALPLLVLLMVLPVSWPLWALLPELRFVPLPWRWLVVLLPVLAILLAACCERALATRPLRSALLLAAGVLLLAVGTGRVFYQGEGGGYPDERRPAVLLKALEPGGTGTAGQPEYSSPPFADDALVPRSMGDGCLVADPMLNLPMRGCAGELHAEERAPEHLRLSFSSPSKAFVVIKLRGFAGWRWLVNGQDMPPIADRNDGLVVFPVVAGANVIDARWVGGSDLWLGKSLSLLAVLLLVVLLLTGSHFRKREADLSRP